MRKALSMVCVAAVVAVGSLPAATQATTYTLTVIEDTTGPYAGFGFDPAVNDAGQVAYQGLRDADSKYDIVVEDSSAAVVVASSASGGGFVSFREELSLNNLGQVARYRDTARG